MENLSVRVAVSDSGFTYRQIAAEMGVSSVYLSKLMGNQLSVKNKLRILSALEHLKGQKVNA